MAKHESPVALMATSQFYRVLLERTFDREGVPEDAVPLTTIMLTGDKFAGLQRGLPSEAHDA